MNHGRGMNPESRLITRYRARIRDTFYRVKTPVPLVHPVRSRIHTDIPHKTTVSRYEGQWSSLISA